MTTVAATPSARQEYLLEACYQYVLGHGLTDLSLRPLATAVGSSPRVLLFLFESKENLVRTLLGRARQDEMRMLRSIRGAGRRMTQAEVALAVWEWLADPQHRGLLSLWVETYARSLIEPEGPWAGFAQATVEDWLRVLAPAGTRSRRPDPISTALLAVLRGGMLDLLATGDVRRVDAAVRGAVAALSDVELTGRRVRQR